MNLAARVRTTLPWLVAGAGLLGVGVQAQDARMGGTGEAVPGVPYWQSQAGAGQPLGVGGTGQAPMDAGPAPAGGTVPPGPRLAQVWLDWAAVDVGSDPSLALPGVCARTPHRALARFAIAAQAGDLNGLLGAYQWRGKSHAQSDAIIARLATVQAQGHWEASRVSMWTGADDLTRALPAYWRWNNGGQVLHLVPRQVDDCWFVEFSGNPGQVLTVEVESPEPPATAQAPAGGWDAAGAAGSGNTDDNGVIVF